MPSVKRLRDSSQRRDCYPSRSWGKADASLEQGCRLGAGLGLMASILAFDWNYAAASGVCRIIRIFALIDN